jgi:hypothetical protein
MEEQSRKENEIRVRKIIEEKANNEAEERRLAKQRITAQEKELAE